MYRYFVSYAMPNGFGSFEVIRDAPITTYSDIQQMTSDFCTSKGFSESTAQQIVILNFQPLGV